MYNKIVVALGLEHGHGFKAMDVARHLLSDGGEIVALHVIEPVSGMARYFIPDGGDETELKRTALDEVNKRVGEGADATPMVFFGHAGRKIPEYAAEVGADLIVIGSHKAELGEYQLGATAARVVRHATCPVHVLR